MTEQLARLCYGLDPARSPLLYYASWSLLAQVPRPAAIGRHAAHWPAGPHMAHAAPVYRLHNAMHRHATPCRLPRMTMQATMQHHAEGHATLDVDAICGLSPSHRKLMSEEVHDPRDPPPHVMIPSPCMQIRHAECPTRQRQRQATRIQLSA